MYREIPSFANGSVTESCFMQHKIMLTEKKDENEKERKRKKNEKEKNERVKKKKTKE